MLYNIGAGILFATFSGCFCLFAICDLSSSNLDEFLKTFGPRAFMQSIPFEIVFQDVIYYTTD
jgi:hypothetical protein